MRIAAGIVLVVIPGLLFLGQLTSVVNLRFAQRVGLQEDPNEVDPLFTRLEVWTARWDLVVMWLLPVAGALMIADHSWWPYAAIVGGALYIDTGGRELVKWLGLRGHGVRVGGHSTTLTFVTGLVVIALLGVLGLVAGLVEVF